MERNLTQISEREYQLIASGQMNPQMAAQYLKEERIQLRNFSTVLKEMYTGDDLMLRLIHQFQEDTPEANPKSIIKKIQNWVGGRNRPTNREEVFHIGFALRLKVEQVNTLLGICTDYGIHYREARDAVYTWFLRAQRSYLEARRFLQSLPPIPIQENLRYCTQSRNVTHELRASFLLAQTEEELRQCYLDNMERMGHLHFRAFHYFQKYLNQLIRPSCAWGGVKEPDYSIEAVMEQYLSMQMPSERYRGSYTVVQKLLKQNWPNATALKNIRLRKEDVPRKLLLLLYVVTENVMDDEYDEMDEDYVTAADRLEDHCWTLNAILSDCGMPPLDPRNATDWLILYSLATEDEPMSQRMEQVVAYMFETE